MRTSSKIEFSTTLQRVCCCVLIFLGAIYANDLSAQSHEDRFEIYFRQDVHRIEPKVSTNQENLNKLHSLLDEITTDTLVSIAKIRIDSWTSPEPGVEYNIRLSQRRSNSIKEYIQNHWTIPGLELEAFGNGIAWDKLRRIVDESTMHDRVEILDILDNEPEETWGKKDPNDRYLSLLSSREMRLKELSEGATYEYLYNEIYPELRFGSQVSLYFKQQPSLGQPTVMDYQLKLPTTVCESFYDPVPFETYWSEKVPIVAFKTNLLFDAITVLNVEAEVPIGNQYSVAAKWIFPWWVTRDNGNAIEILCGQLEGRYWFGDRENQSVLTGWYAGVYAGGGLYDLQYRNNGYQGEFFLALGVGGGYAHTINKSETLRMEYAFGLGYLSTDYRYYEGMRDNKYLVWQYNGKYSWFGPTKAEVSLSWLISRRKRGGRR